MILAMNTTFVGLTVVFLALIMLSLLIALFTRSINAGTGKAPREEASLLEIDDLDEDLFDAEESLKPSDEELVAVLTAAVAASLGRRNDSGIIVRSFRRIPQNAPVWNKIGRSEYIANKL